MHKRLDNTYLSPPLANRVQILANNNLSLLIKGCNSIVRNAISHGSIVFQYQDIKYIDHDKSITMASYDFSKLFDDLVDNCHSFVIAILLFLSNNSLKAIQKGLIKLPLGIRQLFIDSFTSHGELEIASMVESETIDGRKQLNIFCNTKTPSRLNHIFDGLNIAYHIMKFGGEDYNRLAIMMDSNKPVVSSLFINANRLKDAIENNENIDSRSKDILETSLLWYDSSRLIRKINAWKNIAIPIWRMYKKNLTKEREKRGLKVLSSRYLIRLIENKSTEKISRIEAHVVLKGKIEINVLQKEPAVSTLFCKISSGLYSQRFS